MLLHGLWLSNCRRFSTGEPSLCDRKIEKKNKKTSIFSWPCSISETVHDWIEVRFRWTSTACSSRNECLAGIVLVLFDRLQLRLHAVFRFATVSKPLKQKINDQICSTHELLLDSPKRVTKMAAFGWLVEAAACAKLNSKVCVQFCQDYPSW